MFQLFLSVFIGGGIGSVSRYGISLLLANRFSFAFPLATFAVNLLGSFLIGVVWGSPLISEKRYALQLLAVGFCGGFTTFSAFSLENLNLLRQGEWLLMLLYALASVVCCLGATACGYATGRMIVSPS